MGFREKMRKAQGSNAVSLDVVYHFNLKTIDGKPSFVYYDKEKEKEKAFSKPIEGMYIGSAMRLSAFSQDLGPKGNRYFSRPYFSLDNITLFAPGKGRARMILSGDMEEITNFLLANAKGNIQKKKLLYIGTEGGLVVVETNMSIAIDQLKSFEKDTFLDFLIKLTPKLYSEDDKEISTKCKKDVLGSFAIKNPPTYASITKGVPITQEISEKLNAEALLDQFLAWKEYIIANKTAGADDQIVSEDHEERSAPMKPVKSQNEGDDLLDETDDLPF